MLRSLVKARIFSLVQPQPPQCFGPNSLQRILVASYTHGNKKNKKRDTGHAAPLMLSVQLDADLSQQLLLEPKSGPQLRKGKV